MADMSPDRRIKKGLKMMLSGYLEQATPETEAGEFTSTILVEVLSAILNSRQVQTTDLFEVGGEIVFNLASNFNAGEIASFKDYLSTCLEDSAKFDGEGNPEGLQLTRSTAA